MPQDPYDKNTRIAPLLHVGMEGNVVWELQEKLVKIGLLNEPTGVYAEKTVNAMNRFWKDMGINPKQHPQALWNVTYQALNLRVQEEGIELNRNSALDNGQNGGDLNEARENIHLKIMTLCPNAKYELFNRGPNSPDYKKISAAMPNTYIAKEYGALAALGVTGGSEAVGNPVPIASLPNVTRTQPQAQIPLKS